MLLTNNTAGVIWNNGTAMTEIGKYYCGSHNCCCHSANEIGGCTLTACTKIAEKLGENKMIEYTNRWKDFQFRSPIYLDGHFEPNEFDLVKWGYDSCFSVGKLIWDPKEESFDFESIGMRYLEYYVEGLNEWVMAFAKMKEVELRQE